MLPSLLIYFHENKDRPLVSWATFDSKKQLIESANQIILESIPRHNLATILIPSLSVLLTQAILPTRQRQKMIQAIPYALEEQLTEDVENLHFALGQRDTVTGAIAVAVVAHAQMENYQRLLAQAGLTATVWLPEVLAVPLPTDGWGLLPLGDTLLVRTGLQSGFAIELNCLSTLLPMALVEKEDHPPQCFEVFIQNSSHPLLIELQTLGIPIVERLDERGPFAWFVQGLSETQSLNLLQGDYRPVSKISLLWRPWRLTILLLLLWGMLQGGKLLIEHHQLNQQFHFLLAESEKVYRETFPESQRVVNPRVQMEQKLTALRTQQPVQPTEDFLTLLTQFAPALQQVAELNLERMDYRQGRFELQLSTADLQTLEQLKQRLSELGFTVEIQSASNRNRRVESQIRIQKKI